MMRHAAPRMAHAKPVTRQVKAKAKVYTLMAIILATIVSLTIFQMIHYGWADFTERPPGIGNTPLPGDD